MTPQKLMKSRVNTAFLMMCLTLAVQTVISIPTYVFALLSQVGMEFPSYYTEFVLMQFLYPIGTCALALIVLRIIRIPSSFVVTVKPVKADFFPWLGLFLGVAVVMNYLVNGFIWLLEQMELIIPDVFASYEPADLPQAICYFVILALLPPVCEEVLCRASIAGLLKNFHPWTAVAVSAFAFGMMHGTLQQIPFAFVLGIVLGFVYVKTGNLLYPILFHFVNNAWACVMTYVFLWMDETTASCISYGADLLFLLWGVASLIWLLKKKQFTLGKIPHSLSLGESVAAVVKAPFFWIFTGLYGGVTLTNLALSFLEEFSGLGF